jgi:hypothetical protein
MLAEVREMEKADLLRGGWHASDGVCMAACVCGLGIALALKSLNFRLLHSRALAFRGRLSEHSGIREDFEADRLGGEEILVKVVEPNLDVRLLRRPLRLNVQGFGYSGGP